MRLQVIAGRSPVRIIAHTVALVIFSKTESLTGLIAAVMQKYGLRLRWWLVSMSNADCGIAKTPAMNQKTRTTACHYRCDAVSPLGR
jgi:hypothetical protein